MTNAGYPTFNNYNKLDFQYADDEFLSQAANIIS